MHNMQPIICLFAFVITSERSKIKREREKRNRHDNSESHILSSSEITQTSFSFVLLFLFRSSIQTSTKALEWKKQTKTTVNHHMKITRLIKLHLDRLLFQSEINKGSSLIREDLLVLQLVHSLDSVLLEAVVKRYAWQSLLAMTQCITEYMVLMQMTCYRIVDRLFVCSR